MKKLFLIIGAPGSGKTTDAELIATRHKISHTIQLEICLELRLQVGVKEGK